MSCVLKLCVPDSFRRSFYVACPDSGIARNILTARLERLTELGIIERYPLPDRANTDGYRLTEKGEDLYPVIVALMQWGDRWLCPNGKPPTPWAWPRRLASRCC